MKMNLRGVLKFTDVLIITFLWEIYNMVMHLR